MKVVEYVKETKGELKHVSWPTKGQAVAFTVTVIVISLAVSIFLGFFDFVFSQLLTKFVL